MTTYYVGPGGNDGNAGTSWALRKLTLNGAEDIPVVASDQVIVGPGTYREDLVIDVSGGAGTEIVYIADVTGENTDGVGGVVRISGSDNDTTVARGNCISASGRNYRTFRGFLMDFSSGAAIDLAGSCTNWLIEECAFGTTGSSAVYCTGNSTSAIDMDRCVVFGLDSFTGGFYFNLTADDVASTVTDTVFMANQGYGIVSTNAGGITGRNCSFIGTDTGVRVINALAGTATAVNVENSILFGHEYAFRAAVLGDLTEDYNCVYNNAVARTNVAVGGNSNAYAPLFALPVLHSGASQAGGFRLPWWWGELSEFSQIARIAGNSESSVDLRGMTRPATSAKKSWGAIQYQDIERETSIVYAGSVSLKMADASRMQLFQAHEGNQITVSVQCYREADYAGTNPQMIIRQPGQSDRTTTDAGSAESWNVLTDTFTPASAPGYVVVELVSNNTAAAGNYAAFFDAEERVG
jgi:hypothetical protein